MLAPLPVDPSGPQTRPALGPIVDAEGADRGSKAPAIIDPLNAPFVAELGVERTFPAAGAVRHRLLPLVHAFVQLLGGFGP